MSAKVQAAPAAPQTDPDADLFARASRVRLACSEMWAKLAKIDNNLEPLPKKREARDVDLSTMQGAASRIAAPEQQLRERLTREAEIAAWLAILEAILGKLQALRSTPAGNARYVGQRLADAVQILQDGPDASGVMAQELYELFVAHGEPRCFAGRSGLRATRERAEELGRQVRDARADLASRIAWAENALDVTRRVWSSD